MIRPMEKEDAPAVRSICESELGYRGETEKIREMISQLACDGHYFLAVFEDDSDRRVTGFIQAQRYSVLYSGNGWNVISLAVAKNHQRRGIGRSLMEALERKAGNEKSEFIRVNSREERTEAHAFYEHLGYSCDKTQKRFIKFLNTDGGI